MNQYLDHFYRTPGDRDIVFQYFINLLKKKPATIIEIGCARDLRLETRYSDGWSSVHFAQYVNQFGGKHIAVDTSRESLESCRQILDGISNNTQFINGDGYEFLSVVKPTAVFLDGGDSADEMARQMSAIDTGVPVLCDDFHAKGAVLSQQNSNYVGFRFIGHGVLMALYGSGLPVSTVEIPIVSA